MIVWAILGFIVWIPVLLFGTSNYCFQVASASFSGEVIDKSAEEKMRYRINMYYRGFQNFNLILKALNNVID